MLFYENGKSESVFVVRFVVTENQFLSVYYEQKAGHQLDINSFVYINFNIPAVDLINQIEQFYIINNKPDTLKHVRSVAGTNIDIAKQFDLDVNKCYLAGLLHDIGIVMKPEDMIHYAEDIGMDIDESENKYPFLLHQRISKNIAEQIFRNEDTDILSAIECHTTLKANPGKYDMSLFIADKLSWDQEGKPPFYNQVKSALAQSLESACLQYMTYMLENDMILYPHRQFVEARIFLENQI